MARMGVADKAGRHLRSRTRLEGLGSIFSELTCRFTSGYTLREVIDLIQPLKFQTDKETPQKH